VVGSALVDAISRAAPADAPAVAGAFVRALLAA
jgi:hypothetical protein